MRRRALVSGIVVLILFALAIGIWYAVISEDRGGKLTVSFLNVGQGDAIFIDAPSGRQALIDGGRGRVVLRELARASPWWDRSIDVVVATHPDLDHIGGLPDVLARYRVGLVMRSSVLDEGSADSAAFDAAADAEAKQGAALLVGKRGKLIDLGGGASMESCIPTATSPASKRTLALSSRALSTARPLSCSRAMRRRLSRSTSRSWTGKNFTRTSSKPGTTARRPPRRKFF